MICQFFRFSCGVCAALSALAIMAVAQVQPNVQINPDLGITPIVGAPTITITSAAMAPGQGVRVKWSANVPTLTQLVNFDLTVRVNYEGGKVRDGNLNNVTGNLREAIVPVEGDQFPAANIKTTLHTTFHTPSTATHNITFTLGQSTPPPTHPSGRLVEVTSVTKLANCLGGANKDCFEVRWTTRSPAPSVAGINGFSLKLDVGYANGQQVGGTTTASANQTQAVIALIRPANVAATTAAVALTASITFVGQVVTVK
ncbi:MAG: hypothetical protein HYR56_05880 [Acidobacteria bacterium]|nr:hypothetical protein [Acidobacteriota bacterium]MBI3424711.1 hypothetical protein [Acidobacteriota bacterium]